jgi:hypothetical protein
MTVDLLRSAYSWLKQDAAAARWLAPIASGAARGFIVKNNRIALFFPAAPAPSLPARGAKPTDEMMALADNNKRTNNRGYSWPAELRGT